jgi:hypothetical protein
MTNVVRVIPDRWLSFRALYATQSLGMLKPDHYEITFDPR